MGGDEGFKEREPRPRAVAGRSTDDPGPADDDRLYKDALDLSIGKVIDDITTILTWIKETDDLQERRRHVEHAIELLEEMRDNLDRAIEVRKVD